MKIGKTERKRLKQEYKSLVTKNPAYYTTDYKRMKYVEYLLEAIGLDVKQLSTTAIVEHRCKM